MNINAGTNQYNLSLKKMKEEKRPTFATIFDKLDARSKKLNPKNPLNAVMTNDQMYRYYLEETEPMLREIPDDYDLLDDVIGGKSLKDMKLSEFAKLLSGNLDSDRNVKYETLVATISPTPAAPIVPSMISIASPPTPPASSASAPASSAPPPSAPLIPAPSSSVASSIAAPVAVSGLVPGSSAGTGSAPVAASTPAATGSAPAATGSAAPAPAPAAASAPAATGAAGGGTGGRGLTISTAPIAGLTGLLSAAASSPASLARAGGSAISSVISSVISPKPSPSGASIPSTAVASAATTTPGTGVPTATPASGAATPAGGSGTGAAGGGTAAGAVSPSAVASSITATDTGYYDRFFTSSTTDTNPSIYNNALNAGLSPPKIPDSIAIKGDKFSSKNLEWVKHINDMNQYNKSINDPTGEFSFTFTETQNKLINALERNGNNAQKVYELIINKKIKFK